MRQVRFLKRLTGKALDPTVRDREFTVAPNQLYIVVYEAPFMGGEARFKIMTRVGTVSLNVRAEDVVLVGEKA